MKSWATFSLLGWWVLWTFSDTPTTFRGFPMTAGWQSEWGGEMEACLRALHYIPDSVNATCVPAGVLLRPLSVMQGHPQPKSLREFAEFDLAPEFERR